MSELSNICTHPPSLHIHTVPIGAIAARARADPSLILGSESSQQLTRASARGLRASELTLAASSDWWSMAWIEYSQYQQIIFRYLKLSPLKCGRVVKNWSSPQRIFERRSPSCILCRVGRPSCFWYALRHPRIMTRRLAGAKEWGEVSSD